MLLELWQLSQSLKSANVAVGQRDDHLVGYSKAKPLFRVTLSDPGEVRTVSLLETDRVTDLLKYEVSKGGSRESAPGFNVPRLLLPPKAEQEAKAVDKDVKAFAKRMKRPPRNDSREDRQATLDGIAGRCIPGWADKAEAIKKCLTTAVDVVASHLDTAEGDDCKAVAPLRELLRRARLLTPDLLREQLVATIRQMIIDGSGGADADRLLQLLFTKEGVVLLELADWEDTSANHPSVWQAVNRVLLAGKKVARPDLQPAEYPSSDIADAFGDPYRHIEEKMPERKLPRLGNVKLRSTSKSKPCQTRYGWVEGDSFPVNLDLRSSLADSLAWLTANEREGQTYRDISNSCGFDLPALLLAYPDPLPPTRSPALAAIFAKTGQTSPTTGESQFTAAAELVIRELDELKVVTRNAKVTIFVLAKRDKARTKLLFSRQFSADRIAQAVRDWKAAAANLPPVFIRQFGVDKKPRWVRCDDTPFPSEVARYLNRVWQRGGEGRNGRCFRLRVRPHPVLGRRPATRWTRWPVVAARC